MRTKKRLVQATLTFSPRRRNLWVTDTLQWRRKPGSLSPRTCAGFSSLLVRSQLPFEPVAPSRKRSVRQGRFRKMSATGVMRQLARAGSGARASSTVRAPIG
jgi:hypothetical protein